MEKVRQNISPAARLFFACSSILLLLFALHRGLSATFLAAGERVYQLAHWQMWLVGLWSDAWIAALGGTLCFLVGCFHLKIGRIFTFILLLLVGAALCLHQPYVEFFHHQFIPQHIVYFFDKEFITASRASFNNPSMLVTAAATLLLLTLLRHVWRRPYTRPSTWRLPAAAFFCLLLGVGMHALSIRYRVQWFIPEPLQLNLIENLFRELEHHENLLPLTAADTERCLDTHAGEAINDSWLRTQLMSSPDHATGPYLDALKKNLSLLQDRHKRPLIIVLLVESLRPSEVGLYRRETDTQVSLTPHLDDIAKDGLVFSHAYATGTVTRGGQEATFCGYPGSLNTSFMRGEKGEKITCLPEFWQKSHNVETFWFHGGEGRFDAQINFWRRRGVQHLLSLQDFSPSAAKTDWGVGDVTMFRESLQKIRKMHDTPSDKPLVGMILTVSNHIPWHLPSDASERIKNLPSMQHPSHLTTAYTDEAIGTFVDGLKEHDLWSDTLLVIASDHGIIAPTYHQLENSHQTEEQLSHMVLMVSGGLMAKSLPPNVAGPVWIKSWTSQADIAGLLARMSDTPQAFFFGETLLASTPRRWPIVNDLGRRVYAPQLKKTYNWQTVLAESLQDIPLEDCRIAAYMRAVMQATGH